MSRIFQRKGNWWIDFVDARGRRHRKKVCPVKRVAEEALSAMLTARAREEWVGVIEDSKISFADFTKVWAARVLPAIRPGTARRWEGIVRNHLRPFFKGDLRAIDLGRVEAYTARRLEAGASKGTCNREVECLRHILKRAVAWKDEDGKHYLKEYPLTEWKRLKEPSGRTRFLDEDELARLLAACDTARSPYMKPYVLCALNTACRRGELLNLTRADVDWKLRTAKLRATKNGEDATIPLNDVAFGALRSLPVRLDGRLFPWPSGDALSHAFERVVLRAGIEDFHLHDTRHCVASYHAMDGMSQRGLQGLLRHRDPRMTTRYAHLSERYLREAVNRVQIGATPAAKPANATKADL